MNKHDTLKAITVQSLAHHKLLQKKMKMEEEIEWMEDEIQDIKHTIKVLKAQLFGDEDEK